MSILLFPFILLSQEESESVGYENPTLITTFQVGQSMPFGGYYNDNQSGFADPGMAFDLGLMFLVRPSFGISVDFLYLNNPMNLTRYSNAIRNHTLNGAAYQSEVSVGTWRNNAFLMGIAYKLNNKKVSFDLNLRFGMLSTNSPNIDVTTTDTAGNVLLDWRHRSERNASFAVNAGMQFRVQVIKQLYLTLNGNYLLSNVSLRNSLEPDNSPNYYSGDQYYFNFGSFNLLAGLSYEFEL